MPTDLQSKIHGAQTPTTYVMDCARVQAGTLGLCLDQDSREVLAIHVATAADDAVACALAEAITNRGRPDLVLIDNGPAFVGATRLALRLGLGVERRTCHSTLPKGRIERALRDIRTHLADITGGPR